jgi:energy-coupling factor transporter ATP-binding protein EcfA2
VPNADIRRRVAEMSEYFGITGWYDKNTEELSGGQKQLLNLASIMVMRPEVLLLDEPTAQLDPLAKKKFIDTVLELNRDFGITIMCVEHNLADIYSKVDRVLVLEDGNLIYNNTPQKTAECLVKTENPLVYGLPSSVGYMRGVRRILHLKQAVLLRLKKAGSGWQALILKETHMYHRISIMKLGKQLFQLKMCSSDTLRILQMYLKISALI